MSVKVQWATPDADKQVLYMARVSNPDNQESSDTRLLNYCMEHGHVSPFEMANACLMIETTRDIGRQILRHRSFSFQEFSQRYQSVDKLPAPELRECRLQDTKNRQNSVAVEPDSPHHEAWTQDQRAVWALALETYRYALQRGVAKEQARAVLPEGLTPSRLYMNGTLRSWIHYLQQRLAPTTQHEHRVVAARALVCLRTVAPSTFEAFFPWGGKV